MCVLPACKQPYIFHVRAAWLPNSSTGKQWYQGLAAGHHAKTCMQVLEDLWAGMDYRSIGTKYLPGGSFGNGGAMCIAPLGLAYR